MFYVSASNSIGHFSFDELDDALGAAKTLMEDPLVIVVMVLKGTEPLERSPVQETPGGDGGSTC